MTDFKAPDTYLPPVKKELGPPTTERPTLPREPTDEMISAGAGDGVAAQLVDIAGIWRAMYDAAPTGDTP